MQVTIERSSNLCKITPWVPSLIPVLSFTRAENVPGQPGKPRKTKYIKEKLFKVVDGSGYFPGGVYHRVSTHLAKYGITIEHKDYRDMARMMPEPVFTHVEPLREDQPETLVKIATHDCGMIVCNTGWGKSFLIKQICLMYPTLKIIIISPGRDDILNIYDRVAPAFPAGTVGLIGCGKHDSNSRRIICSTAASIMSTDLRNCDLLLFDEAHACGYNQIADALKWVERGRMFGFTASPEGRGDQCEIIAEAFFGPIIAEFEYEDSVAKGTAVPIEVHLYEVSGKPIYKKNPIAKKREAYWRNLVRNLMIACLAKQIPDDEQTLIMVETVEHGMYLKKLLPEYTFVYGTCSPDEYDDYTHKGFISDNKITPKDRDRIKKEFAEGTLKKVISTGVWKKAVDFPQLTTLIRADGAASKIDSIQIPGRLSRTSDGKTKGVLIDFIDGYDPWPAKRAADRIRLYRKKKWLIVRKGDVNEHADGGKVLPG